MLQTFSNVPATPDAIDKLKLLKKSEEENIVVYNQRYKTLTEQVEGRSVDEITSTIGM